MEYNEKYARKMGKENIAYDFVVAQRVLKTCFLAAELVDFDWLKKISDVEDEEF